MNLVEDLKRKYGDDPPEEAKELLKIAQIHEVTKALDRKPKVEYYLLSLKSIKLVLFATA